jgi:hypothetical protein
LSSAFVSASAVLAALWPTPQAVGWRHGSVHDAQHIGSVDKPRERWAGARRQGRGSRGTWLRWRELCVLESNAGHCELQISGGMRVITRHSSPEIGRDAMALVSGKQGSWRPSRCQRGADTCRSAWHSRRRGRGTSAQPTADGSTDLIRVQAIMRVRQWSQRKNLLKWLKQKIC